jgi:hypothetical protein
MADETNTDAPTTLTEAVEIVAEVPVVETEQAAEEVEVKAETTFGKVEREIETWFADLRGNLQGLETETHNKIFAAKEALKARLTAIL